MSKLVGLLCAAVLGIGVSSGSFVCFYGDAFFCARVVLPCSLLNPAVCSLVNRLVSCAVVDVVVDDAFVVVVVVAVLVVLMLLAVAVCRVDDGGL